MLSSIVYFILITLFLVAVNVMVFVKDYKDNKNLLVEHHSIHRWIILALSIVSETIIALFMFSSIIQ